MPYKLLHQFLLITVTHAITFLDGFHLSDDEETAMLCEEADMPLEKILERYGPPKNVNALKKQQGKNMQSPVIRAKPSKAANEQPDSENNEEIGAGDAATLKQNLENTLVNGGKETDTAENEIDSTQTSLGNGNLDDFKIEEVAADSKEVAVNKVDSTVADSDGPNEAAVEGGGTGFAKESREVGSSSGSADQGSTADKSAEAESAGGSAGVTSDQVRLVKSKVNACYPLVLILSLYHINRYQQQSTFS